MSPRVILVTDREHAELTTGDRLYAAALHDLGAEVRPVVWNDPDWARRADGDIVVMRAAWDVADSPDRWTEYRAFISRLEDHPGIVCNQPDVLRWDLDKAHFGELLVAGLEMPETVVIERPEEAEPIMAARGWSRAVLKPTVGCSGHGVTLLGPEGLPPTLPISVGRWMVQEFLPEIAHGELDVVLIDGQVSHMIRKVPAEGEFRSNWAFGSIWKPEPVPAPAAEAALQAAAHFPSPPHYMRVDGVLTAHGFRLLECEVGTPSLFFTLVPEAAARMARATLARLR